MTIENARKGTIYAITISILAMVILFFCNKLFPSSGDGSISSIVSYIIPILFASAAIYKTRKNSFKFYTPGTFKTVFTIGLIIPATALVFAILSFLSGAFEGQLSILKVIGFAIYCMCTGFFEEMIFRVLSQGYLMDGWKNQGQGPLGAILTASVIFALVHFLNLAQQPHLVLSTIAQVGYTFALGFMLGVIYYKTNSLLSVALLHGMYNFIGSFSMLYSTQLQANQQDITPNAILISWIIMLPGLFCYYFIFKGISRSSEQESL